MTTHTEDTPQLNAALTGRDQETALLHKQFDQAQANMGSVILISGEAGLGKSRLAQEVAATAEARGMTFLRGVGDPRGIGPAYGPFVEVLATLLENATEEEGKELRSLVATLVPHLWESLLDEEEKPEEATEGDLQPELRQTLFLARLGRHLGHLSQRQPLVLCLEDIHNFDSASIQVLHYLANRNNGLPLLVVATYRPAGQGQGDSAGLARMLQTLQTKSHVYTIDLKPLSAQQTNDLVRSCFARDGLPADLPERIYLRSAGVPLFIVQYLEMLSEQGTIYHKGGLWWFKADAEQEVEVPASIRETLRQRMNGLEPDERKVLSHGSIQGEVFVGALVSRTIGWPIAQALRLLSRLTRKTRIISSEKRGFRFMHTLLAEIFYDLLPESRRIQAHQQLAFFLEKQKSGNVEDLAYHFFRAGAHERALPYLLQAAESARQAFAYREARNLLAQADEALESIDPAGAREERLQILLERAEIESKSAPPADVMELCHRLLNEAGKRGDDHARAMALMHMGSVQTRKGDWDEATRLLDEARELFAQVGDDQKCAAAYTRLGTIAFERGNLDQAIERLRDARETATRGGNMALLGTVYGNWGIVSSVRGEYADAIVNYTSALKVYRKINHMYGLCQTYHNLGLTHGLQQEWATAVKCYEQGEKLADDMGALDVLANILVSKAPAQLATGNTEDAAQSCARSRTYMEQLGDHLGVAECYKVEGMISMEEADFAAAESQLQRGRHLFVELENPLGVAECDLEIGRLAKRRGAVEDARRSFEEARSRFSEIGAKADVQKAEDLLQELTA